MSKFRIVGSHRVCGFAPGTTVDGDDLTGADVPHLIASGHIVPSQPAAQSKKSADDGVTVEEQSHG
jgi:hypothetical protein